MNRWVRRIPIVLILALLALSAAAHVGHHLVDTACDEGGGPTSHPCASCSGLHSPALTEAAVAFTPPAQSRPVESRAPQDTHLVATGHGPAAPRAPPLA
jgi:hypothetical protein